MVQTSLEVRVWFVLSTKKCLQHRPQIFVERPKTSIASRNCFSALTSTKTNKNRGWHAISIRDWLDRIGIFTYINEKQNTILKEVSMADFEIYKTRVDIWTNKHGEFNQPRFQISARCFVCLQLQTLRFTCSCRWLDDRMIGKLTLENNLKTGMEVVKNVKWSCRHSILSWWSKEV